MRYRHWWWLPGWAFAAVTELPALLAIAWLVPGFVLLLAGRFTRVPMLIMFPALALALCYFVLRQLPVSWPRFREESAKRKDPASRRPDVPLDALLLTLVIAGGYLVWQLAMNSETLIVTRDPGVYLQYAYWIAGHGTAHITQDLAAFGGTHSGMSFASLGFFQTGTTITPSFMPGLPLVLAGGVWAGGLSGVVVFGPVIGACAVLSFAGLAGRLAGPRWAPAAALLLAFSLPQQYTSRATFSEPLVQILLFGGLSMIIDSMVVPARRHGISRIRGSAAVWQMRVLAAIGGLALGLAAGVDIVALNYLLPVLPFLAILVAGRRPQVLPLAIGAVAGSACAIAAGYVLDRPYLDSLSGTLSTFGYVAAGVFAVCALAAALLLVPLTRRWIKVALGYRQSVMKKKTPSLAAVLPWLAAVIPVVGLGLFLSRPYLQILHNGGDPSLVARIQRLEGFRPDGTRSYAEDSIYWVVWYLGLPALLLGVAGFAMLLRRCSRVLMRWRNLGGPARVWGLPLLIFGWGAVTVLWAPDVVPDQPEASRRLVPVVLPGLIAAGIWVASRLKSHSRVLGASRITAGAVATCTVLAMAIPAAVTTLGVGVSGHRVMLHGVAFKRTGTGEVAAVRGVCAAIGVNASVIIVSPPVGSSWSQVIRGMCGTPVVRMDHASVADVAHVVAEISRLGRHPVLLGSSSGVLASYGGTPRRVLDLLTTADTPSLVRPPQGETPVRYTLWLTAPDGQAPVTTAA
jgi:hypothetical protein